MKAPFGPFLWAPCLSASRGCPLFCRRALALRRGATLAEQEEAEQEAQRRAEGRGNPETGHPRQQIGDRERASEKGDQGRGREQRPEAEAEDQQQKPEAAVLEVSPAGEDEDEDRRNLRQRESFALASSATTRARGGIFEIGARLSD